MIPWAILAEALIGPVLAELAKYYREQRGEEAVRKAEAYGKALDAWSAVERVRREFTPIRLFDLGGGGEVPDRGSADAPAPPSDRD